MDAASQSQRALVIGLGASGRAVIPYLLQTGWQIRALDTRSQPPGIDSLKADARVEVHLGALDTHHLEGCQLVVMSPGLSPYHGPAAEICALARQNQIPIVGEIELFAQALEAMKSQGYHPKVIGITGTNGKTTTTTLVTKMLTEGGIRARAVGNIGPNALTTLLTCQAQNDLPQVWVLELSSFQLETTSSLHFDASAILNISEDHLDWHGQMRDYVAAKRKIFDHSKVRVLNADDEVLVKMAGALPSAGLTCFFGQKAPTRANDWGLITQHGLTWLAGWDAAQNQPLPLCPEGALRIRGRHNAMNALAALALVCGAGFALAPALRALSQYQGEPHRVELVATHDGVDFIDDSKGTNVGAVIAAVQGLGQQGRRILLILGGDGKGQDFQPLIDALSPHVAAVGLIGQDGPKLQALLDQTPIIHQRFETLEMAMDWLWSTHRSGDVMLLSPACASWDMFKDYADRSQHFITHAKTLSTRP